MSAPIPASEPVVIPSQQAITYDRWAILSQTVSTDPSNGRISLSAVMCRSNANAFSPRAEDRVSIADPDIATTAATDETLGPLLAQRIATDFLIAKRIMQIREII